ncbi:hypothetical protein SCALM49S_00821 [Streptomyces californicus]
MSVGEDDAGAPGPSRSTGAKGSDVDPAGDTDTHALPGGPEGAPGASTRNRTGPPPGPPRTAGSFRRRALGDAEGPAPRSGRTEAHPGHRRYAARADALGPGAGRAAADRSGAAGHDAARAGPGPGARS